jgi:hypothetical protein
MSKFKDLFLPSPKDLGWSDDGALQSSRMTPNCTGHTWEEYAIYIEEHYPIRKFIINVVGNFLNYKVWGSIKRPVGKTFYWLKCHILPSHRYHKLDLRQKEKGGYRYGWIDVDHKMLYAWFNLLEEYFKEEPYDLSKTHSLEEIATNPNLTIQYAPLKEAKDILHWWKVGRQEERRIINNISDQWYSLYEKRLDNESGYWAAKVKAEQDLEDKTDQMLMRLIKIRRTLWT